VTFLGALLFVSGVAFPAPDENVLVQDRAERGAQFKLWQHLIEKLSS